MQLDVVATIGSKRHQFNGEEIEETISRYRFENAHYTGLRLIFPQKVSVSSWFNYLGITLAMETRLLVVPKAIMPKDLGVYAKCKHILCAHAGHNIGTHENVAREYNIIGGPFRDMCNFQKYLIGQKVLTN